MDKSEIPVRTSELQIGDFHAPLGFVEEVKPGATLTRIVWTDGIEIAYGNDLIFIVTRKDDE